MGRLGSQLRHVLECGRYYYDIPKFYPHIVTQWNKTIRCNYYPITTLTISPPEVVGASKLWLSNAVIAESFARTFYRNAFTIGLPALEIPKIKDKILQGDELKVDIGKFGVENLRTHEYFLAKSVPEFMRKVLFEGGLVEYYKKNKQFPWSNLGESRKRANIKWAASLAVCTKSLLQTYTDYSCLVILVKESFIKELHVYKSSFVLNFLQLTWTL